METDPYEDPTLHDETPLPPVDDGLSRRHVRLWAAAGIVSLLGVVGIVLLLTGGSDATEVSTEGVPAEGVAALETSTTGSPGTDDADDADGETATDDGSSGEAGREDALLEYAECMRDNGVDMPDPRPAEGGSDGAVLSPGGPAGAPDGGDGDVLAAAQEACGPILDAAGMTREPPSAEQQAEQQDALLQVAQCMRDRGHDFEDPDPNQSGGTGFAPGSDAQDESFRTDLDECSSEAGLRGADDGGPDGEDG